MKKIITIITILTMCSCFGDYPVYETVEIDYCTFDVYQSGIVIDQECMNCLKIDYATESVYYVNTHVTCENE